MPQERLQYRTEDTVKENDINGHLNYGDRLFFSLQGADACLHHAGFTQGLQDFVIDYVDIRYLREAKAGEILTTSTDLTASEDHTNVTLQQRMQIADATVSRTQLRLTALPEETESWDPLQKLRAFEDERSIYLAQRGYSVETLFDQGIVIFATRVTMQRQSEPTERLTVRGLENNRLQFSQYENGLSSLITMAIFAREGATLRVEDVIAAVLAPLPEAEEN